MSCISDEALDHLELKMLENWKLKEQKKAAENLAKAEAAKLKKYKDQALKQFNQEWAKLEQPLEQELKAIQEHLQYFDKLKQSMQDGLIGCKLGKKTSLEAILANPDAWHLFKQSNALHVAADSNQRTLLEFLLDKGFSVQSRDFSGRLPIDLAIEGGHVELAEFLQKIQLAHEEIYENIHREICEDIYDGLDVLPELKIKSEQEKIQIPKEVSENCISDILKMLDQTQDKIMSRSPQKNQKDIQDKKDKLDNLTELREQELALNCLVKFIEYKHKAEDFLDHYQSQLDKMKSIYALFYIMLEANPYNLLTLSGFLLCRNFLQGLQDLQAIENVEEKTLDYLINQWALHQLLNDLGFELLEKSIECFHKHPECLNKHPLETEFQSTFDFVNDKTIVCLRLSTQLSRHKDEAFLPVQELVYFQEGLKLALSQDFQGCLGGSDEDLLNSIPLIEEIGHNLSTLQQQGGKIAVQQQLRECIKSQLGIKALSEIMRACRVGSCYQIKDKEIDFLSKKHNLNLIDSIKDEYIIHSLVYDPVFKEIAAEQDLALQEKQKIVLALSELAIMKAEDHQKLMIDFKKADAALQKARNKQAQALNAYENALKQHQHERARIVEKNNKNHTIGFGINVGLGGSGPFLTCFPSMRIGNHRLTLDPAYRKPDMPIPQLKYEHSVGEKAVDKANAFTRHAKDFSSSNLQFLAIAKKPLDYLFERVTHNVENLVCASPMYSKSIHSKPALVFSESNQAAFKEMATKTSLTLAGKVKDRLQHSLAYKYFVYDLTTGIYSRTKSAIEKGNSPGAAFSCAVLGQGVDMSLSGVCVGAVWTGSTTIATASTTGGPLGLAGGLLLGGFVLKKGTELAIKASQEGGKIAEAVCHDLLKPKKDKP